MKLHRIAIVLASLLLHGIAVASEVASRIDSVIVYPQGASVTRVANLNLSAGLNEVSLSNLTRFIEARQLQVEVSGEDVEIGQVRFERIQRRDAYDEDVRRLEAEIETLRSRMTEIDDSTKSAQLRLKFLAGLAEGYAKEAWFEGARGSADVGSWQDALNLLGTGADEAHGQIRKNGAGRERARKDLSVLERELAALRGFSLASTRVNLALATDRAQNVEVRLHYFQRNAQWMPVYEARLDSDRGRLQLAQRANVTQATDEDWRDVRLTLSTSEPSAALTPPVIDSEFLDLYVARQRLSIAPPPSAAPALEEVVVTASWRPAEVGNYAVSYEVPGRVSLQNDVSDAYTFDLARHEFSADLKTRIVPRESLVAFLAARFVYDKTLPLYAGRMQVFVDGAYVGETEMPTALPQAEVTLPMGQDRRVEVNVINQGGNRGKEGIIGRRKVEFTDFIFDITNRRASMTSVEVLDRYPVARHKEIEVSIPKTATPPAERDLDGNPGLVVWARDLAANESWRIRHQYEISYPAKRQLISQ